VCVWCWDPHSIQVSHDVDVLRSFCVCVTESNIMEYLKTHKENPVTGAPLSAKDLIVLKFHRNTNGVFVCVRVCVYYLPSTEHTLPYTYSHSHTPTHPNTHIHTPTPHTYTHHSHSHTPTHSHTHAHIHTHPNTRHTHTQGNSTVPCLSNRSAITHTSWRFARVHTHARMCTRTTPSNASTSASARGRTS